MARFKPDLGGVVGYANSVIRAWVALMSLLGLYCFAVLLVALLGDSVWSWFVAVAALAIAVGVVDEWFRRRS